QPLFNAVRMRVTERGWEVVLILQPYGPNTSYSGTGVNKDETSIHSIGAGSRGASHYIGFVICIKYAWRRAGDIGMACVRTLAAGSPGSYRKIELLLI